MLPCSAAVKHGKCTDLTFGATFAILDGPDIVGFGEVINDDNAAVIQEIVAACG